MVAARALRGRLARPPARRGRPPRARALVAAARRGRSRTRCGRRAASASPTARARTCAWSPATAPATACSTPARSGRWRGGPARRTCSPTCRARTSTSSTSTAARRLARIRLPHVPHEIAWSADGRRLYVNLHRSLAIYDASGRRTGRIRMPGRQTRRDLRPRPQRHARRGRARRERSVERGRADGPGRARPRAVPRRRALHAACASPRPAAGCSSPGRSPTSGSSCARARPARAACSPRRGVDAAHRLRAGFPQLSGWCCPP